jgi:UDP-N-acetylglucosamine 1-carboxyvinyltransferase
VIINNIPDIIDINKLITLLNLGVKIKNGTWLLYFQADEVNIQYLETEASRSSLRGIHNDCWTFLARFGKGYIQNQVVIKLDED